MSSRSLHHLCRDHMDSLQRHHYQSLLSGMRLQRRFRSWDDVRKQISLLDVMYLNLSRFEEREYLLTMHQNYQRTLIRGMDIISKRPFLSIKLVNDVNWTEMILLIMILNHSDVSNAFVYDQHRRMHSIKNGFSIHELDVILRDQRITLNFSRKSGAKKWVTLRGADRCCFCFKSLTVGTIIISMALVVALITYVVLMQHLLK